MSSIRQVVPRPRHRQIVPAAYVNNPGRASAEEIEHRALVELCRVVSPWSLEDLANRGAHDRLGVPPFLWWHTPSWRPSKVQAALLAALGTIAGVPDLVAVNLQRRPTARVRLGHELGFVELKGPTGRPSRPQLHFRDLVQAAGYPWELCRVAGEAEIALRRWRMIPTTEGRSLLPRAAFLAVLEELEPAADATT